MGKQPPSIKSYRERKKAEKAVASSALKGDKAEKNPRVVEHVPGGSTKIKLYLTDKGLQTLTDYASSGMTYTEIAKKIGIERPTLWRWRHQYPQIEDALNKGELPVFERAEEEVQNQAFGQWVEETTETVTLDADGNVTGKRITTNKKYIPGRPQTLSMFLYNKMPDKYKPMTEIKAEVEMNMSGKLDVETTKEAAEEYIRGLLHAKEEE